MSQRHIRADELAVLEDLLPKDLTQGMQDVAQCLFESLVQNDDRCGEQPTGPEWRAQLLAWATMVMMQLQYLADVMGGEAIYMAKGVAIHISARDRKMFSEFKGNNHKELARKHGISVMRVRQIVGAIQREQYEKRQIALPM